MAVMNCVRKFRLSYQDYRRIYAVPVFITFLWTISLCLCVVAQFPSKSTPAAPANGADKKQGDSSATLVDRSFEYPECTIDDTQCIEEHTEKDRLGKEAILQLHRQMDDDHDGDVEPSESDEFLRDELKYEDDFERHSQLHRNDKRINAEELWKGWKYSEVYNWTVDRTAKWLEETVDLPQYAERFQNNGIEGSALPRLAANSPQFMSTILGIADPLHRQKISIKATDVVLFGPPKAVHNYLKDWLLVISLVVALGGCWFAFVQHRFSQSHVKQLLQEMETLSQAEGALKELQEKLTVAQEEHKVAVREKQSIEKQLTDEIEGAKREAQRLQKERNDDSTDGGEHLENKLRLAEEELVQVRCALEEAERRLTEQINWSAPMTLQQWLQLTYEIEYRYYVSKRVNAAKQLQEAKEECEKLRRKRATLIGSFRIAHGSSLDSVDQRIVRARSALHEVTAELKERTHRWTQIESLCQFAIVNNPGFQVLMASMGMTNGSDMLGGVSPEAEVPPSQLLGMPSSSSVVGSLAHLVECNPPMGLEECEEDMPPVPQSYSMKALPMPTNPSQQDFRRFAQQRNTSNQNLLSGSQIIHRSPLSQQQQQPQALPQPQSHLQQQLPQLNAAQQHFASSRCSTMPQMFDVTNGTSNGNNGSTGSKYILGDDSTFERMSSQDSSISQMSSSSQGSPQQALPHAASTSQLSSSSSLPSSPSQGMIPPPHPPPYPATTHPASLPPTHALPPPTHANSNPSSSTNPSTSSTITTTNNNIVPASGSSRKHHHPAHQPPLPSQHYHPHHHSLPAGGIPASKVTTPAPASTTAPRYPHRYTRSSTHPLVKMQRASYDAAQPRPLATATTTTNRSFPGLHASISDSTLNSTLDSPPTSQEALSGADIKVGSVDRGLWSGASSGERMRKKREQLKKMGKAASTEEDSTSANGDVETAKKRHRLRLLRKGKQDKVKTS